LAGFSAIDSLATGAVAGGCEAAFAGGVT